MKYLILSELNRNYFLFLSYFIISIIQEIVKIHRTLGKDIIFTFNRYYIYTLSDFLSIIPVIIIIKRSKGISESNKENVELNITKTSTSIKYIYTDTNQKRIKRIFKLLILTSFFEFLGKYINITYEIIVLTTNFAIKKVSINSSILFNIISKYILTMLILHLPIYKHHYLSLIINLIFLIGFIIYDIINISEARSYIFVVMKITSVILFSVEDVYAKLLLSFDSISPYSYLLYRGIFVNILAVLYSIAFIFVKIPDENGIKSCIFTRFWKAYENKLSILLNIISFFNEYLYNLNVFLIIDKFSPIHFIIAHAIGNIGSLLISIVFSKIEVGEFFIRLGIHFILFLSALIYNEFIILNFCGFEKHTKLFLLKESNRDLEQIINNNDNENDLFSEDENINKNEIINDERNSINDSKELNIVESNISEFRESNINK